MICRINWAEWIGLCGVEWLARCGEVVMGRKKTRKLQLSELLSHWRAKIPFRRSVESIITRNLLTSSETRYLSSVLISGTYFQWQPF